MKSFPSLYFSNLLLTIGTGLLTTYLSLYLTAQNVNTFWIGLMMTSYYAGLLTGSKIGYLLIKRVGHIRAYAASTGMIIACCAMHAFSNDTQVWLLVRFIFGMGMMCNFMVLESWLNEQAEPEQRGSVFAFYMVTSYLGMVIGQYTVSWFPDLGVEPLLLVIICVSLCIIPIAITRRIHPAPLKPTTISVFSYWRKTPQALTTILLSSMIVASFYGLTPVLMKESGLTAQQIALVMSATVLAGLLAQWPMGWLSDRYSRSHLIRINALCLAIICGLIFIIPFDYNYAVYLSSLFGLFAFSFYSLASALANSRVSQDDRVGVSSALLVTFGIGASLGSAGVAVLMDRFGYGLLYGVMAAICLLLLLILSLLHARMRSENPENSEFIVTASDLTTSPLAAVMDPRIDEPVAHEQLLDEKEEDKEADADDDIEDEQDKETTRENS
ncbi:MFS transporter [Thalassotalea mangrovi]|uniref:MFS transporter n=1 Tax=Thalassotalea mangrovi TaxID=2572245 RepID=A0A4U1B358_9GAMM|nr:MFS transporter [Thalassotalea mangrovi]TKB44201.1 MFS transporter [Thalassotalea mangrovi]